MCWREPTDTTLQEETKNMSFPGLMTRPEVEAVVGLSCSAIYRLMSEGLFPRPIRIGKRAVRWRSDDVLAYLDSRPKTTGDVAA